MSSHSIRSPRKLIEVALPLDVINTASVRESYIYRGNPSSMHKWWAQRPLAAARAVIFAQLVNDPGYQQGGGFKYGKNKKEAASERKRLFKIIEDLVLWENITDEEVLRRAKEEIHRSWREVCDLNKAHPQAAHLFDPERLPGLYDPFAGGGTIPLEAQRLGLEVYASDLNPVAVLINKAMIEIPPKFAGRPPVSLTHGRHGLKNIDLGLEREWPGATGLAEDVRYYGSWMHDEAEHRVGHFYPPVEITAEIAKKRPDLKPLVGQKLTVIAWLWARTVKSPNPAFSHVDVPLASTFILSSKKGQEVYVHPVIEGDRYHLVVRVGTPPPAAKAGTSAGKRKAFRCLVSGAPIDYDYIRAAGKKARIGQKLLAIVADSAQGRVYLSPVDTMERVADDAQPIWRPDCEMPKKHRNFQPPVYGMTNLGDIFTRRQLLTLGTLSDLVIEARSRIHRDAVAAGMVDDGRSLDTGGAGAPAYADGVVCYLAFILSKMIDYNCTLVPWYAQENRPSHLFSRQAIPMVWDFVELNPLCDIGGAFTASNRIIADALDGCPLNCVTGNVRQLNATSLRTAQMAIFSTDPPYYDNIAYADLSDFFYVWLRRALKPVFPELFATMAVPKTEELIAAANRHGGDEKAEAFFLDGMTRAMQRLAEQAHPAFPVTIYYAFKQSESDEETGTASTGWETFLGAVLVAGFAITGTWPMRTERSARSVGIGTNALASCIILVCRRRPADAPSISRRQFIRELNGVLPEALDEMTKGSGDERSPVAPVDLSQAIIGPGMAVFSKYAAVLEADGSPMNVRTALQLINRFLAEDDFDPDTQFCLHWFDQYGWGEGRFGEADTLARAKGTSVDGVRDAGVVESGGGVVRIRKWSEYPAEWDPRTDTRNPVWETLHHLIRAMKQDGDSGAGEVLAAVKGKAEAAQQLAYRLYTLCERRGWAEDARAYNELITSWTGIESAAGSVPQTDEGMLPGFEKQ